MAPRPPPTARPSRRKGMSWIRGEPTSSSSRVSPTSSNASSKCARPRLRPRARHRSPGEHGRPHAIFATDGDLPVVQFNRGDGYGFGAGVGGTVMLTVSPLPSHCAGLGQLTVPRGVVSAPVPDSVIVYV